MKSIALLFSIAFFAQAAQAQTLKMGIIPQQKASILSGIWKPILEKVSDIYGTKIEFATTKTINGFQDNTLKGAFDIVYTNPMYFVEVNQKNGFEAFAHAKDKKIKGILVKKKGSSVSKLEDLAGKKLAFPAPTAFGASVLQRAALAKAGIRFRPIYTKNHSAGYQAVSKGIFPAAGGVKRTFNAEPKKGELEIFWTSEGYTPHAFAMSKKLAGASYDKLQDAFMKAFKDPAIAEILKTKLKLKGLQKAKSTDWADIVELSKLIDKDGNIKQ